MATPKTAPGAGAQTLQWSSRFAFLMATVGASVGLGNLWRFPFMTGQNGGSAFVFVYLLCVVFVAYPILMAELAVGRHKGLSSAVGSTAAIAKDAGKSGAWGVVGLVGVIGSFLILPTYSVVAGQVMAYSAMSFLGEFAGAGGEAGAATSLYEGPGAAIAWQTLYAGLTILIVVQGLRGGIERACTILMPLFFLMLASLCAYALATGAAAEAIAYLFKPRFSEITPGVVLAALGQSFFSIGVGAAILLTYGSFLSRGENIAGNAAIVAGSDTLVAVVAGLMIFPIVFAFGLDPAAGSGLIFGALPAIFSGMPAGSIIGGMFFFLAFIAAMTSSIAMLLAVSLVAQEQFKLGRRMSAVLIGVATWAIGAGTVLAPEVTPWFDFVSGSIALPLGGLLVAILAGWVVPRAIMRSELQHASDGVFRFWRLMIRYVAPIAVFLILLLGLDAKFNFGLNGFISGLTGG